MRSFGVQSIFAVDVGSVDDTELTNYGDKLSGWWLLWKRWNPWAAPIRVGNLSLLCHFLPICLFLFISDEM
mgnify:FL=1